MFAPGISIIVRTMGFIAKASLDKYGIVFPAIRGVTIATA